jgi:hypothetical protein
MSLLFVNFGYMPVSKTVGLRISLQKSHARNVRKSCINHDGGNMIATMMLIATWTGVAWWGAITVLAIIMALAAIYHYFGSAGLLLVFVLVAMGIAGAIQ